MDYKPTPRRLYWKAMRNLFAMALLAIINGCVVAPVGVNAQGARDGIFRQFTRCAAGHVRNIERSGLRLTAATVRAGADKAIGAS
jgi:hypothetical protein